MNRQKAALFCRFYNIMPVVLVAAQDVNTDSDIILNDI